MLKQYTKEAFNRSEQRAMQHDRALSCVICRDIFKTESFGQIEVALNSAQLPLSTYRVAYINVDFGSVERCVTGSNRVGQAVTL